MIINKLIKKIRSNSIIPGAMILVFAFIMGFIVKDVFAGVGNLHNWIASVRLMPQRIESRAISKKDVTDLGVMEAYSNVLDILKTDYYGKRIDDREITYSAIRGMLYALGDPFTRFLDPDSYKQMREENEGNFTGIGAQLETNKKGRVFIKEPLPDSPAILAGVKSNDIILAVNGKSIKDLDITEVVKLIRGPEGTKVKLTIERPGRPKPIVITIVRKLVQFQMIKYKMLDDKAKIGYVRLYQFNEQSDVQFDKALAQLEKKNMKGLVFDLRGNPGGLLQIAVDIGSRFIESGPVVIIQERGGQKNPLYVEEEKHNHKRYPLVVLVDKSSASASEIVSGAIKDDGVGTLVGTTTFGKGRVQTIIPMADGSAVAITTAKYLTPNGTDIHKKGIKPDIEIEATDNFDPNDPNTDVQLSKGIQVLKEKMGLLPKSMLDKPQAASAASK